MKSSTKHSEFSFFCLLLENIERQADFAIIQLFCVEEREGGGEGGGGGGREGLLNKFPDFFRMGTFIDSTHMKL